MTLSIRAARPGEASLVLQFVRELAEYEKALARVRRDRGDAGYCVVRREADHL